MNDSLGSIVEFDNYKAVYKHKDGTKEGGGLAFFIKNEIQFAVRNDLIVPADKNNLFDCLFIEVQLNKHALYAKNIIVGLIYRTPRFRSEFEFISWLGPLLFNVSKENKDIIILGDMNIDLLKTNSLSESCQYFDMMLCNSFIPTITRPTRVTQFSATLIDHIFLKQTSHRARYLSGTLLTDISDHFTNFIFLDSSMTRQDSNKYITYRPYTPQNIETLRQELSTIQWTDVLAKTDVNEAYDLFIDKYTEALERKIPMKMIRCNRYNIKKHSWITKGILISMKTRDKLHKKTIAHVNEQLREAHLVRYRKYRNVLNKVIRIAKTNHWNSRFLECSNDIKRTWQNINDVLNKTSNKSEYPKYFTHNNRTVSNPKDIADTFNSFYTNIGPNLAQLIQQVDNSPLAWMPRLDNANSFFMNPTDNREVELAFLKLKPKLSSGCDDLSSKLIVKTYKEIIVPIVHIVNLSIISGKVPDRMKVAKIKPVFKSGDKYNISNYRPISLLPTLSKILERIIYNRLYMYLTNKKLLSQCQYGFRESLSTELAILELCDRIYEGMTLNNFSLGIFVDLKKAFDTLNHEILINKLEHYGIRGNALDWFKNYLCNRYQFTNFNSCNSELMLISCGIPQGSILGPLLFLVYINDLTYAVSYGNSILFADDTNILYQHHNLSELEQITNMELEILHKWFAANKLSLNVSKTKYMIFHKKTSSNFPDLNINIYSNTIERVSCIKFLGVVLNENLTWMDHITFKGNKISSALHSISRLKYQLPEHILLILYQTLISPHFSYALSCWGDSPKYVLNRMNILQKKALRIVSNVKYNSHCDPLFKKYKILKVHDLFKLQCIRLAYKNKFSMLPPYHSSKLPLVLFQNRNPQTRQCHDIAIHRHTTIYKRN
jgi:hypothetical protein